MKISTTLMGLFVISAGLPALLHAQPNPLIQQFGQTQRELQFQKPRLLNLSTNMEAPELYPGENADVGPQRILRLKPRKTYFEVIADSQCMYSDNVYLSEDKKVGGALFINTIQAALAPEAYAWGPGQFAPMLGFRSQWFNYAENVNLSSLDFNAQTAFINGRYQAGNWQFYAACDLTRLLDQPGYNEIYRECMPTLGFQRFFPVNDKLMFIVSPQVDYHFTDSQTNNTAGSAVNNRLDASLNLSLSYLITPKLIAQPFYRFQYSRYPDFSDGALPANSRDDLVNTFGGSLAYFFNKYLAVRVFTVYEINHSSYASAFSYHKFDAGGGLSLDLRF
jgi:hypothetical protein